MKILDLFCCCGGAGMGLSNNGKNKVIGIDITNDHDYPFEFANSDVFDLPLSWFKHFDLIWASPPCQVYTWSTRKDRKEKFPDSVAKTRDLLKKTGKPYIIENVQGAPLRKDLMLCGEMFGLRVLRHRIFEIEGFTVMQPPHIKHRKPVDDIHSYYACVSGHGGDSYSFKMDDWMNAMKVYHIKKKNHITQAVPPAYADYILRYFTMQVQQA